MGEKQSYKTYTKEFKEEAVALVHDQGYSVPGAAKSLGIASNIIYRWKQQIEDQQQPSALIALSARRRRVHKRTQEFTRGHTPSKR